MNVELLRTFLVVADRGSVTAAAQVLGYSQPTVSQHIMRLEAWVHRPLFTRGAHMELTEAGAVIAPLARVVLVACGEMSHQSEGTLPAVTSTSRRPTPRDWTSQ